MNGNFNDVSGLLTKTLDFKKPDKKKPGGLKSGERNVQAISPSRKV